jgi:hypothetical protein
MGAACGAGEAVAVAGATSNITSATVAVTRASIW